MGETTQSEREVLRGICGHSEGTVGKCLRDADRLAAIEREIGGRRESYKAMRDFMDTDPVARSCYQGFINTLDELRAIIDAPDAGKGDT